MAMFPRRGLTRMFMCRAKAPASKPLSLVPSSCLPSTSFRLPVDALRTAQDLEVTLIEGGVI